MSILSESSDVSVADLHQDLSQFSVGNRDAHEGSKATTIRVYLFLFTKTGSGQTYSSYGNAKDKLFDF